MPLQIYSEDLGLTEDEIAALWKQVRLWGSFGDEVVTIRVVTEAEMQELNARYREVERPTNVLTFSYDHGEHDMALCMTVAEREAAERSVGIRDYVALLLVHGFLHVTGMDHERSVEEMERTQQAERDILAKTGFIPVNL